MVGEWRLYAFDFDGTLVDSYSCLPEVWRRVGEHLGLKGEALELFVEYALREEDLGDARGEHDIGKWIRAVLDELELDLNFNAEAMAILYWEYRIRGTRVLPCAREVLEELKRRGCVVASVSGSDGIKSLKRRRITRSGLIVYFDDVIVAGEDVEGKGEALILLAEKYGYSRENCVFIDDKPGPINDVYGKGFPTVKIEFECILKKAWEEECNPTLKLGSICELLTLINQI